MNKNKLEREHFAFLRSYWEQIKLLPSKKQKCEVFEAILSVQFFENEINSISFSTQNQMILWEGLKPILKQSQKGYIDKIGARGSNPSQGATQDPTLHKDKDKDKELRENYYNNNILFSLDKGIKDNEINKYINHLLENDGYIKNETAYKLKIKKQIDNKNKNQLEDFEKWYLEKECNLFNQKYVNSFIDENEISYIYPYTLTEKPDPKNKFIIIFNQENEDNVFTQIFENKEEIETYLQKATDGTI